ncbi:CesT family type III secretion system chaperone [Pseudovibrio ascidiaceicola]|uniref:CesT family type III secretion system chaperone n=1 Tax=Pseudovibrio ascidiaceicola TaxID=285279 RepID=UPI003D366EBC
MAQQFRSVLTQLGEKWGITLTLDEQHALKLNDRNGTAWQLEHYPDRDTFTFSGVVDCRVLSNDDYAFWLGLNRERDLMGYSYISIEEGLVYLECAMPANALDAQQLGNLLENMTELMVKLTAFGTQGKIDEPKPMQSGHDETQNSIVFYDV